MQTPPGRWILAFDGSCGSCGGVADAVAAACGDRLEVLPLQDQTVADWRSVALGAEPAWKPVLFKVAGGADVRAWTGIRLVGQLVARLGRSPVWVPGRRWEFCTHWAASAA